MQPTERVLDQTIIVFPLPAMTSFAVLQSRLHEVWSVLLSATLKQDQRYNPTRAFQTFPFPEPDPRTVIPALEAIGETLYETRAAYMIDTDQGLTKTYNALKDPTCDDPRIHDLRRLHETMDRAVLDAYAWPDIQVPPYCPKTEADRTALQTFEDEVIDRLYLLNAQRAREEQRLGLTGKRRARRNAGKRSATQSSLFEEEDA